MCNLYRMNRAQAEIAGIFSATLEPGNAPPEVYPGYPAMVGAEGRPRTMAWGFPLALRGKAGQVLKPRPVNNARTDKLDGGFWRASFVARRCLIPVTAWAEAEGARGRMTRSWFSLPDAEVFACAGVWRDSAEWGPVFAMVMTEACVHVGPVHDRMPVILRPGDYRGWTAGTPAEAFALCQPYDGAMLLNRTAEPWSAAKSATAIGRS